MNTDQIIAEHFINTNINEAIQIIEKLEYDGIVDFIENIPLDLATRILLQMNNYKAAKCLELMKIDTVVLLIGNIDLLSIELLLRQCNEEFRNNLLSKIDPNIAEKIRQKLQYSVNSVGAFMNLKVFSLQKNISVNEAIDLMKKERELIDSEIFITDEKSRIEGMVKVKDLVMAEGDDQISSILTTDIPKIFADEPIKTIVNHPEWIKYRTIPVIERSGALIGTLHFEEVLSNNLKKDPELTKKMVETGNALGELYRIGLTGLLQSVGNSD